MAYKKRGRKTNEEVGAEIQAAIERAIDAGIDELGYRLEIAYGQCIDKFYSNYEPHYYDRTYSLYSGSNTWDNPLKNKKKIGKNRYYIAIYVGAENVIPNINSNNLPYDDISYRDGVDFVFDRSFEQGIHGMTPEEAKRAGLSWHKKPDNPTPKRRMDKEYKRIANNNAMDLLFGEFISRELSKMK